MEENKEFIFIKNDVSLVVQIHASLKEIQCFYQGIIRCLTEGYICNEPPFRVSIEVKQRIEAFLRERHSLDKRINKLISFFRI